MWSFSDSGSNRGMCLGLCMALAWLGSWIWGFEVNTRHNPEPSFFLKEYEQTRVLAVAHLRLRCLGHLLTFAEREPHGHLKIPCGASESGHHFEA